MATCEKREVARTEYVLTLTEFEARALQRLMQEAIERHPYITYTRTILTELDEVLR
jgi:hypothetical protein